jgi:hypothetical protein
MREKGYKPMWSSTQSKREAEEAVARERRETHGIGGGLPLLEQAMIHTDGDWEQIPLDDALGLVAKGLAYEMRPDECKHYDDGLRSFHRFGDCNNR